MGESLSLKQSFCVHKLVLLAKNICGYERMCVRGRVLLPCVLWKSNAAIYLSMLIFSSMIWIHLVSLHSFILSK